ncbi:MAG: Ig-like domain-containing protein [Clostridia bacterium]|nr:Ig-like domain-containing protein [Clostridia bacterium]
MKKSVVIIIGLIYGLSIIAVTLFGLKHKTFNEIVYVSQVEIIEDNASYKQDGSKYLMLTPDENGNCQYQLVWTVSPDNATNQQVTFNYDKQQSFVTVDENGLVSFTGQGAITISIIAADGTSQSDKIQLINYKVNK